MADVTITAANVKATTTTVTANGTAGGTITAGMPIYMDAAASNKLKACDANVTTAEAACVGIALHGASTDQPLMYAVSGDLDYGSGVFALGTVYVVSATAGAIAPSADLDTSTATNYGTILGIASTSANLKLAIKASGALNP